MLVGTLVETPLGARRVLAPALGAASVTDRGLGLSLLRFFPLNNTVASRYSAAPIGLLHYVGQFVS